LVYC
jgi:hypothetical protein